MTVRQTSLLAYKEIKPELGARQRQVFEVILTHPGLCNREIAQILNLPINCVTGRCKELREHEPGVPPLVIEFGTKEYDGRKVLTYAVNPEGLKRLMKNDTRG